MTTVPADTTFRTRSTAESRLIVAALVVGALLGQIGGFLDVGPVQSVLFAVSSVGLAVGAALLAVRHAQNGEVPVAVGFALLAVAETMIWTAGGPAYDGGEASFAGATLFYVPSLLMVSLPAVYPSWVRGVGTLAAVPFAAHSLLFLLGTEPTSQGPVAIAGYLLLTVTVIGWIVSVVRSSAR